MPTPSAEHTGCAGFANLPHQTQQKRDLNGFQQAHGVASRFLLFHNQMDVSTIMPRRCVHVTDTILDVSIQEAS